jgi:hypothetical protein
MLKFYIYNIHIIAKWVKSGFLMIVPIYAKLSTGRKLYLKYHEEEKLD